MAGLLSQLDDKAMESPVVEEDALSPGSDFGVVPDTYPIPSPDHDSSFHDSFSAGSDVDLAFCELEAVIPQLKSAKKQMKSVKEECNFIRSELGSMLREERLQRMTRASASQDTYVPLSEQINSFGGNSLYGMECQKSPPGGTIGASEAQTNQLETMDLSKLLDDDVAIPTTALASSFGVGGYVWASAPVEVKQESTVATTSSTSTSPLFMMKSGQSNLTEEALQSALDFFGRAADRKGHGKTIAQSDAPGPSKKSTEKTRYSPYPSPKQEKSPTDLKVLLSNDHELTNKFLSLSAFISAPETLPFSSASSTSSSVDMPAHGTRIELSEATSTSAKTPAQQESKSRASCSCRKPRLKYFLNELLQDPKQYNCIEWIDRSKGIFKFLNSSEVARLWGQRKNKPNMKYENFARSLRTYVKKKILLKPRNKLVYQFVTPPSSEESE